MTPVDETRPPPPPAPREDDRPHVVIVGGGFAGLYCARGLRRAPVRVTVIDRSNFHLFQPLLYQVATASLSPGDIASPIRTILRRQENTQVWMGNVVDVDRDARTIRLEDGSSVAFDYLVLATGATHAYFGNDHWSEHAPGLKTVDDAVEIRRRFLLAFEKAEREADESKRRELLTFVVVGAGPTGVELAGAMAEIANRVLPKDFRAVNTAATRILLLEGVDRVLPPYPPELSEKAHRQLERLGVEVRTDAMVTDVGESYVMVGESERIDAANVFWAAGVAASELGGHLRLETDRSGRVPVEDDGSIEGDPRIFVIGDLARMTDEDGSEVPGVAPAAIQMGKHVARTIRRDLDEKPRKPFRYVDKGDLATVGRASAVARIGRMKLSGVVAWVIWVFVHILYLTGFRNRIVVMIQWAWAYLTYQRGIRLITGQPPMTLRRARPAEEGEFRSSGRRARKKGRGGDGGR